MNKHLIISLVLLNVTDDMGIILISNIDDLSAYNISCSIILKELWTGPLKCVSMIVSVVQHIYFQIHRTEAYNSDSPCSLLTYDIVLSLISRLGVWMTC